MDPSAPKSSQQPELNDTQSSPPKQNQPPSNLSSTIDQGPTQPTISDPPAITPDTPDPNSQGSHQTSPNLKPDLPSDLSQYNIQPGASSLDPPTPKTIVKETNSQTSLENASPIQPGQFVIAQEEDTSQAAVFPKSDLSTTPSTQNAPTGQMTEPLETPNQQSYKTPPLSLAGEHSTQPATPPLNLPNFNGPQPQEVESQFPKLTKEDSTLNQPSPNPLTPPQKETTQAQGSSKIDMLKKIALILAVLILIGLIGAVVWFFVFKGNTSLIPAKNQANLPEIEEPPALPKGVDGDGFGALPPVVPEATGEATKSASTI